MCYWVTRSLAIILFKLLFRLQAFGRENIPLKGAFILASNHASYLDPPALGAACPRVLYYLAKEELFRVPFLGWLIANLNSLPIKKRPGDFKTLRYAIRKLKEGKALTVFPEGRRTPDGELDVPLRGIGFLAAKANVAIVPAFIQGSNEALPIHSKFIRPRKIKVYFGRSLRPEEIANQADKEKFYQAIAARTMEEIRRLKNLNN